ncbi:MAG: hypothetical protein AB2L14_27395 [Candidatus Xenobiia bacterium LiM19]
MDTRRYSDIATPEQIVGMKRAIRVALEIRKLRGRAQAAENGGAVSKTDKKGGEN